MNPSSKIDPVNLLKWLLFVLVYAAAADVFCFSHFSFSHFCRPFVGSAASASCA
jgi:hypothetical protein